MAKRTLKIQHRRSMGHAGHAGFTIIELLVYMVIATIAIVVLTSFLVDVTKHVAVNRNKKEIQDNARFILARLTQELRNAESIIEANGSILRFRALDGNTVRYERDGILQAILYDADDAGPVAPIRITTDRVRVTNFIVDQQTSDLDTVSIDLRVEQLHDPAPVGQQYAVELRTTINRRQASY